MRQAITIFLLIATIYSCNTKNKADIKAIQKKSHSPHDSIIDSEGLADSNKIIYAKFDSILIEKFISRHPDFRSTEMDLYAFYRKRDLVYAWQKQYGLIDQANLLYKRITQLIDDGIPYQIPYAQEYKKIMKSPNNVDITDRELMITCQYLFYANNLLAGIPENDSKLTEWFIPRKKMMYDTLLIKFLNGQINEIEKEIYPEYLELVEMLKKYTLLNNNHRWEKIEFGEESIHRGDSSIIIPQVKKILNLLGDMTTDDGNTMFNLSLENGIKKFQERHGLRSDGIIGMNVKDEINVPLSDRIKTIIVNLERCKWLPNDREQSKIVVNIPDYSLQAFNENVLAFQSNVVVGKETSKTVIFKGDMKYVVFSPYWNVPDNILNYEILPGIKENPNYLAEKNMEWVDGQVRQLPGPKNSLGLVKFLFPNKYNIYLHDTPSKGLFNQEKRTFSHGCIRISDPMKMIKFLLRSDTSWTDQKIDSSLHSGVEKYVPLKKTVPVYIIYLTSFVDEKGLLNFRRDIYERDNGLKEMIFDKK